VTQESDHLVAHHWWPEIDSAGMIGRSNEPGLSKNESQALRPSRPGLLGPSGDFCFGFSGAAKEIAYVVRGKQSGAGSRHSGQDQRSEGLAQSDVVKHGKDEEQLGLCGRRNFGIRG